MPVARRPITIVRFAKHSHNDFVQVLPNIVRFWPIGSASMRQLAWLLLWLMGLDLVVHMVMGNQLVLVVMQIVQMLQLYVQTFGRHNAINNGNRSCVSVGFQSHNVLQVYALGVLGGVLKISYQQIQKQMLDVWSILHGFNECVFMDKLTTLIHTIYHLISLTQTICS